MCSLAERPARVFWLALLWVPLGFVGTIRAAEMAASGTVLGDSNPMLSEGATALEAGRIEDGLRLTLAGLAYPSSNRDLAAGHSNACAGLAVLKRLDEALEHCNAAIRLDKGNWRALNNRAAVYAARGLYDLAIEDLTSGLALAPNSATLKLSMEIVRRDKRIVQQRSGRSVV